MTAAKIYRKPAVLSHQPIQFETRHSWNPGKGKSPGSDGNGGIHFPKGSNPNPQPCGAGAPGNDSKNGKGNGNIGTGQCNSKVN